MRCEKEGKQIDREYGAAEIKNIQKLTAALWQTAICGGLRSPTSNEWRKTLALIWTFKKQKICDSRSQINHSRSRRYKSP